MLFVSDVLRKKKITFKLCVCVTYREYLKRKCAVLENIFSFPLFFLKEIKQMDHKNQNLDYKIVANNVF